MFFYVRHLLAQKKIEKEWQQLETCSLKLTEHVSSLRIRFLVDFYPMDNRFRTEAGVSYLITAGNENFLFDLGYNRKSENPSLLRSNLKTLNLESIKIDGVFISHNHLDHVGNIKHQLSKKPALDDLDPKSIEQTSVWTPTPMKHPTFLCTTLSQPIKLRPGIASTGPMPSHLYFLGKIVEQALLVSLKNRGLVLISGCGHPGILKMIHFAKQITGQDVYAVVGGLHLIATKGRSLDQKIIAANQPFWKLPGEGDIRRIIEEIKSLGVQKLVPSAHDSCDVALQIMEDVFKSEYIAVRAGDEIQF